MAGYGVSLRKDLLPGLFGRPRRFGEVGGSSVKPDLVGTGFGGVSSETA